MNKYLSIGNLVVNLGVILLCGSVIFFARSNNLQNEINARQQKINDSLMERIKRLEDEVQRGQREAG